MTKKYVGGVASLWIASMLALSLCLSFAYSAPHVAHADDETILTPDNSNPPPGAGANGGSAPGVAEDEAEDGTGGISGQGGTVLTGNANASTTIGNELNTNNTHVPDNCTEPGQLCDQPGQQMNSSSFTASSTNAGELNSGATTSAQTGDNTAEGLDGTATVVTGNAFAFANVINIINTNIFNSIGMVLFFNEIFSGGFNFSDYDLSYFFDGQAGESDTVNEAGQPQCTLLTCMTSSHLNVFDTNVATVTNSVLVRAGTGDNTATTSGQGEDVDANIETGDAYAAANVFNMVNTNIVNSSYLLLAFNNFGDMVGDVILPGADFFTKLFNHGGSAPTMRSSSYKSTMHNDADFVGTTTSSAETGDNTASSTGEGHGEVDTGDAYSIANTYDDVNSNYFGGTSVMFMFRVFGNWKGEMTDVPAGLAWTRIPEIADDGTSSSTLILITSQNNAAALPPAPDGNCWDADDTRHNPEGLPINNCMTSSSFLASTTNDAVVKNNVDVGAETGGNYAETASGTARIITGNAYSVANVINFVNTNIVGRNWIFAMFNIFGDFKGDISFGETNLGEVIDDADEVIIGGSNDGNSGGSSGGNSGGSSSGSSAVKLSKKSSGGGGSGAVAKSATGDPDITVAKTASVSVSTFPATVDYTVVVKNSKMAGNAYNGVLTDKMIDPIGGMMYEQSWPLGTIVPGDQITLTYSVKFSATSTPGTYTNTARVDAVLSDGKHTVSSLGSTNIRITGAGVVLGESTDQCAPLLTTFLQRGSSGNEVSKLQVFLNTQGSHLPITGLFGPMTASAVSTFQRTYATEILAPAGLTTPTGNVYTATQRKINSLGCGGVSMPVVTAPTFAPKTAVAGVPTKPAVPIFKQKTVADLQPAPAPATTSIAKQTWGWISNLLPF